MKEINNARLKVLLQCLQSIRQVASKTKRFNLYNLLLRTFEAHMKTQQYCTLRTNTVFLEIYSGVNESYQMFSRNETTKELRQQVVEYLDEIINDIEKQLRS